MNKKIEILKKAYKKEKDVKILKRILMVLYTLKKETIRDVSKRLNCSHPTVLYWNERFEKEGLEGLKTRPKSGKPRKISRRQEANLKRIFSKENPEQQWTTKRVSELISEKTGVNYSQRQITRILNRWNFVGLTSDIFRLKVKDWKGTCNVEKIAGYQRGWGVVDTDVDEMTLADQEQDLGRGMIVKVSNDCTLKVNSGSNVAPPQIPY